MWNGAGALGAKQLWEDRRHVVFVDEWLCFLLYVFFFWFPVELRRGFQKVLDMFLPMLELTFKVKCVP